MKQYHFHSFEQINPDNKKISKKLKFLFRKTQHQTKITQFESFVNTDTFYQQTFAQRPMNSYTLLRVFMDCRLNFKQRHRLIKHDLITAKLCFNNMLTQQNSCQLFSVQTKTTPIRLVLEFNQQSTHEGFWALAMYQKNAENNDVFIYQVSFAFMPNNALMIGSIQGGNDANIKHIIKTTTKALHGLRPQQFMVYLLQLIADHIGIQLYAINNQFHAHMRVYDRLTRKKQLFHTDYDLLWQSMGATQDKRSYWLLPKPPEYKDMADISSKKRAMYKRRYTMIDDLKMVIANKFHKLPA